MRAATAQVGNRHPSLARVVEEYAKIANHPLNDLNVIELWTVGNCLLAHTRAFEAQNQAQTLTEPLEPGHLALLTDVAQLHTALILGFPQGRELAQRADQAQIAPEVIEPAARLLDELSQNRDLVSDRARHLFSLLTSVVGTCDWATTRVGYTVYATARNVLLAMGKIVIKANINSGIVGSAIAAGAWQVSGMTPDMSAVSAPWTDRVD